MWSTSAARQTSVLAAVAAATILFATSGCQDPPGPSGYVIDAVFNGTLTDNLETFGQIQYEYDSENPHAERYDMIECAKELQPPRYSLTIEGDEGSLGNDEASAWSIYIDIEPDTDEMTSLSVWLSVGAGVGSASSTREFDAEDFGGYTQPMSQAGCTLAGAVPDREFDLSCAMSPTADNPDWAMELNLEWTCSTWLNGGEH